MLLVDRTWQSTTTYKYGFNGQEQDDEIYGNGNLNTAEFWQYDSRLGRRWNVDPLTISWRSGYSTFNNNPVYLVDKSGASPNKDGLNKQSRAVPRVSPSQSNNLLSGPVFIGGSSGKREGAGSGEDSQSSVKGESGSVPISPINYSGNPDNLESIQYSYELISSLSSYSEQELIDIFEYPLYCGADNKASESSCSDLYKTMNRFLSKNGGTFSDYYSIQSDMSNNDQGVKTKQEIEKEFIAQMKLYNGDYSKIDISTILPTDYSGTSNLLSACPGGTQTIIIYLNSITIHNNTYSAEISYELIDDFGVAQRDVKPHDWPADFWCSANKGLAAFWILQHQYGYNPLLNIYTINFKVTGTF